MNRTYTLKKTFMNVQQQRRIAIICTLITAGNKYFGYASSVGRDARILWALLIRQKNRVFYN
jgi:hypothetical protein